MHFRIVGILIVILFSKFAFSQSLNTIDFKNISFSEALELSKNTGKPVFIDCYTTWCAPCKKMDKTVFVIDSVYTFYNENFVNFKVDMEKGEGITLKEKYNVGSFPTYLFVNAAGEIIHRTASLMPAAEFLNEARIALNPIDSYAAWEKRYVAGDRSNELLLKYAKSLRKVNRSDAQKVEQELMLKIKDEDLRSKFGWEVIEHMGMTKNDRLGVYLSNNNDYFEKIAGKAAVQTVLNRMQMADMYKMIREKNSQIFFMKLDEMRKDPNSVTQRNIAMLQMEYYLEINNADSFVISSEKALNGILENSDADLSFIARRAIYKSGGNEKVNLQALKLARKAVKLNPEEYSNQGTLASICLELKLKEEGLMAAQKARSLADESTSKIQNIAQALVDKLQAL